MAIFLSTIEYVCNFITMPAKLWRDADIESKQAFQSMLFPNGFRFNLNDRKCGTEGLSLLYTVMSTKKAPKGADNSSLVRAERIELSSQVWKTRILTTIRRSRTKTIIS